MSAAEQNRRRPGTIERAFELARGSSLTTVEQIRRRLKAEGYIDWEFQLSGKQIRAQLRDIVSAKRTLRATPESDARAAGEAAPAESQPSP